MFEFIKRVLNTDEDDVHDDIFSPAAVDGFRRGAIFRSARLTRKLDVSFSVFAIIGSQYAKRVAEAKNPREVRILEEVSLAFHEVESRVAEPETVTSTHIENLAKALCRWFDFIGDSRNRSDVQSQIENYVAETSRSRA